MTLPDLCARLERLADTAQHDNQFSLANGIDELRVALLDDQREQDEAESVLEGLAGVSGTRIFRVRDPQGNWRGKIRHRLQDASAAITRCGGDRDRYEIVEYTLKPFDGKVTSYKDHVANRGKKKKSKAS